MLLKNALQTGEKTPCKHRLVAPFGAENGVRTRDPQLGKLMLYQLSYFRVSGDKCTNNSIIFQYLCP